MRRLKYHFGCLVFLAVSRIFIFSNMSVSTPSLVQTVLYEVWVIISLKSLGVRRPEFLANHWYLAPRSKMYGSLLFCRNTMFNGSYAPSNLHPLMRLLQDCFHLPRVQLRYRGETRLAPLLCLKVRVNIMKSEGCDGIYKKERKKNCRR
jgi:hypothetical protein